MSAFTYLITGASRGLGLGYTRQLLKSGNHVRIVAGARNPSSADDLQALRKEVGEDRLYILKLDVEDAEAVAGAVKQLEASGFLKDGSLDCLINNAGVARGFFDTPSQTTPKHVMDNLTTNLFGVMNITRAFLPLLKKGKGKQIFGVSSTCGSIGGPFGENPLGTAYCISKVALNMYNRKLSRELEQDGFTVISLHPGYVKTDGTNGLGDFTVEEATRLAVENVILKLGKEEKRLVLALRRRTHALTAMGMEPPGQATPELAILSNAAALHSLKRPQLIALCKQHGLKGSGKNVELIARLEERGRFLATIADDDDSVAFGDESTASWSVVPAQSASCAQVEADFGPAGIDKSESINSVSSVTSTLRSAGTAFLRTIASSTSTFITPSSATEPEAIPSKTFTTIYPSLSAFQTQYPSTASPPAALSDTVGFAQPSLPTEVAIAASTPERFVFGSPIKEATYAAELKAFTFTMPGTLTASTGSTTIEKVEDQQPSAINSVIEEMTRRAAEARALAEASGVKRSSSMLLGSLAASSTQPSSQGKSAVFEASHKRTFDRMDSITNHWAAKRSVHSSTDLAGMTRSDSRSKISDEGSEPQSKRLKPAVVLQSARGSDRDNKLVARLRESGWSSSANQRVAPSIADSLGRGVASLARSGKEVKAGEQATSRSEQARRKRQLELAKARRKSGAVNRVGLSKRRPSLGVGPKSFTTVKKLQAAPPVPSLPKTLDAPSDTRLDTVRCEPDSTTGARSTPRFAAPTASTSSRAALTAAASPIIRRSIPSPEKPAARKKFDLQESLKRPITWRSHLRSPAVATASTSFSPVERKGGDRKEELPASGQASLGKLLALPPAPTSPFSLSAPAHEDVVADGAASQSPAPSTSSWQPPPITKRPLQPMTPQPPTSAPGLKPTTAKKTISASSRSIRGSEKETARRRLEGLESHARRVRAKAAAAKAMAKPT